MRLRTWFGLGSVVALLVIAAGVVLSVRAIRAASERPPGPPPGLAVSLPFGAIDVAAMWRDEASELERSLIRSIESEQGEAFDPDRDGAREYALLACSGGGSNGAFGAGLLCGWTKHGTRPDFKVVTGVSTGSLQAVLAFLGPKYDQDLEEIFTRFGGDEIYTRKSKLATLFGDSMYDQSGLKTLIDRYATAELLADVAARHARGHRLYVGTTNTDTAEFIMWDLGGIASSGRDDALDHFRNILLASCSIPVLFEPVYFEVEAGGRTYHEMHVDGSAFAQIFFRGVLVDFDDAIEDMNLGPWPEIDLFVIRNGRLDDPESRRNVPASTVSIASRTIEGLFKLTLDASLFRMYVLAERKGIRFKLASIPADAGVDLDPVEFDKVAMKRLFDIGFALGEQGASWMEVPPVLDPDELAAPPEP
jgi:predicted acylesterase/phospholipase RssA